MSAPAGPFLIFRLEESLFALAAAEVAEILPVPILDRPQGAPAVLAGFMNLGGEPLAVIDLGVVLGQPADVDPQNVYRHILHLKAGLGLLVDRVLDLAAFAEAEAPAEPAESVNGVIAARLTIAGGLVNLVSAPALLLEEERQRLAEMAAAAQLRIADAQA